MKLLIKQAFKTLFSSKIFSLLLMVIIFISSLTYTFLQTSTNAFRSSYDSLIQQGQLHDVIVKESYKNQGDFKLKISTEDKETKNQETGKNERKTHYYVEVIRDGKDAPTGDYKTYFDNNPDEVRWEFKDDAASEENVQTKMIDERKEFIQQMVLKEKPKAFQNAIKQLYDSKLLIKNTKSIYVPAGEEDFKIVKYQDDVNINNLVTYDGTKTFTTPLTYKQMDDELKQRLGENNWGVVINRQRGYRWTAAPMIGNPVQVVDPSAFQAVISPSYANLNHKHAITPQKVLDLFKEKGEFEDIHNNPEWLKSYQNNVVWINQMPYFIIGVGNTPDFSYPIIDHSKPIPVPKNEAIVYTNMRGFERGIDSFRGSKSEHYFSIKFIDKNLTTKDKNKIKEEIEKLARYGHKSQLSQFDYNASQKIGDVYPMSWPSNIKIVTDYNDIGDSVILAGQRVAFLENLEHTIMILTNTTTSFLIIFVAATVLLVFKSLLSSRRIKHATLLALGYSKKAIAVSISLATIVLIGLPSVIGYIFGHFLQYPFINIFAHYWTIPIYGSAFSLLSLLITVALPLLTIFAMIFILTHWDLNNRIANMLRRQSKYQFSLARIVLKPLAWMGVKTKYVTSITVSNFGRLILSTLAGIISVTAIIVGVSSLGKAEYAYNQTVNATNYKFQSNFSSPTREGGQYKTIKYHDAIKLIDKNISNTSNPQENIGKNIHWHIPTITDAIYAVPGMIKDGGWEKNVEKLKKVQQFLKYKLQFKPLLHVSIMSFDSWEMANKLMPENQKNSAEANELEFYRLAANLEQNKIYENEPWFPKPENGYRVNVKDKVEGDIGEEKIRVEFLEFVKNSLIELSNPEYHFVPFIISYGVVVLNDENIEKYTYINGDLNINGDSFKNSNIIGIEKDSKAFKLSNQVQQKLQSYKSQEYKPLIINKYMSEKYHLSRGSIIDFDVNNHVDRKNSHKDEIKRDQKFEVIDVINTYDNGRLLTRKSDADQITGLDNLGNSEEKFNGIFAKQDNPIPLQNLLTYSESDTYIASDTITDSNWTEIMNAIIKNILHGEEYKDWFENIEDTRQLVDIYSAIPYVSMLSEVSSTKINNETFKNISQLTSGIIWIIQIISIALSILFAIIVASLLVTSNNKKIATLWTLGYYRNEVMKMFSLIYLLPIIFSIGFGIPLALGILSALRLFVIDFGSILIPFALSWWAILLGIFIISAIFVLSTVLGIKSLKNEEARKTIKGE